MLSKFPEKIVQPNPNKKKPPVKYASYREQVLLQLLQYITEAQADLILVDNKQSMYDMLRLRMTPEQAAQWLLNNKE